MFKAARGFEPEWQVGFAISLDLEVVIHSVKSTQDRAYSYKTW
jgi:hypothetical protein